MTVTNGRRRNGRWRRLGLAIALFVWNPAARALEDAPSDRVVAVNAVTDAETAWKKAENLFSSGQYEDCLSLCAKAMPADRLERWPLLKARAELTLGRADSAHHTIEQALRTHSASVRLRLIAAQVADCRSDFDGSEAYLTQIEELGRKTPWRYSEADDLLAIGEAVLRKGGDPNVVMESFFQRARSQSPTALAPLLAVGQLALELQDEKLAVECFEAAAKRHPQDADARNGLAKTLAPIEPVRSAAELQAALQANPRHIPSLLMRIDQCVDVEEFDEAKRLLDRLQSTNPKEPDAWAFRALIATLRNDRQAAAELLARAGGHPQSHHLLGVKLSQKYRFEEGAEAQRRALKVDPEFTPARFQLAQDLLKLGEEEAGWRLLAELRERETQHPGCAGLLELKERIGQFETLENDDFVIRMERREAAVYGAQVQELLGRAKRVLDAKYDVKPARKVIVEIFPDERDFALRAFGMTHAAGYLGVCFGTSIAANSPAGRADQPLNWEAMLWHEYCHAVTLEATGRRMPRWFSEGISVYEERQQNLIWGQRMTPAYRDLILNGELSPIRKMTAAFLQPPSPEHVQFAYYEASLIVEFLVERFGRAALQSVLVDLRNGLPVEDALERRTDGLDRFEREFIAFAQCRARALAPNADWSLPEKRERPTTADGIAEWLKTHPNNIRALAACSQKLIEDQKDDQALPLLEKLVTLDPSQIGPDCGWNLLARIHRQKNDLEAERRALRSWTQQDPAALSALLRLADLDLAAGRWDDVAQSALRARAIDPMRIDVQQALQAAAEKSGDLRTATMAARAVIALEKEKTAEAEYVLARLLHAQGDAASRRHVIHALEISPRLRPAQQLLLDIRRSH